MPRMERASHRCADFSFPARAWIAWCGCALLVMAGCQSAMYTATALPPQLLAPGPAAPVALELSRLATPAPPNESIFPGDLVEVTIATGAEDRAPEPWVLRVADNGAVLVPLVGLVPIAGMELPAAERQIAQAGVERGLFRQPHVTVAMKQRRSNRVTVVGAVKNPGQYELPRQQSDLLSAIVAAGGLADDASSQVDVRQTSPEIAARQALRPEGGGAFRQVSHAEVDLQAPLPPGAAQVADGAVLTVRPRRPQTIQVLGLVNKPDQFDLPVDREVRVLDALALAGGRTLEVADHVVVVRRAPDRDEAVTIQVSVAEAKRNAAANLRLAPGDVVSVEETPGTLVLGLLKQVFRVGLSVTGGLGL